MKRTFVIWAIVAMSGIGAAVANAQSTYPGAGSPTAASAAAISQDKKVMNQEPNYVLAMAYHEGMLAFADALQGQTVNGGPVNVDFARAAVVEMRRGFDQMKKYNEEYMETISAEVRTKSAVTMQELETQRADLNAQLTALEAEVKLDKPDAKKIATMATNVHTQLDAMSMVSQDGSSTRMTMKN